MEQIGTMELYSPLCA